MDTKQEILKKITDILGIEFNSDFYSRGSTITRESLSAIWEKLKKEKQYHLVLKPIPDDIKVIFIDFLRGFEDHYRILYEKDIVVKIDLLTNGGIGILFENITSRKSAKSHIDNFVQWLRFTRTLDPTCIDCFNELSPEKQELIITQFKALLLDLKQIAIQKQIASIDTKNTIDLIDFSGATINNSVILINYDDVDITIFTEKLKKSIDSKDPNELKSTLTEIETAEEKKPGIFRKIIQRCKKEGQKHIIEKLEDFFSDPDKISKFSEQFIKIVLSVLQL